MIQLPLPDFVTDTAPGPRRCAAGAVCGWRRRDGTWLYSCEGHRTETTDRMIAEGWGGTFVMFPKARCQWEEGA